jgi:glycosyltransferase involved in cell wall biosynthesis
MTDHIPRVSIGLPVYNGEEYLAAAIESLLAQTFTDFELIISDNASTDGTSKICQAYAAQDARIRYYREPYNRGIAWNFTRTFELARGEFFKWHAHDDTCAPTMLQRCVEVLDEDSQAVLSYARPAVIDEFGNLLSDDPATWRPPLQTIATPTNLAGNTAATACNADARGLDSSSVSRRFYGVLLNIVWCLEPYGVMRSAVMRTTGKMRGYCGADKVFLAEMALHGRFLEVPEILFFVRRHPQQYTMQPSASVQRRSLKPRWFGLRLPVPLQMRSTLGYLMLLPAASMSWIERLRCLGVFVRYVFQVRKWKRIFVNTLRDAGVNDVYRQSKTIAEISSVSRTPARRTSAPANSV